MNALASRRDDLTGVVRNLNGTFGALGSQQSALAESVERLPPFMRRANTTFVNLRAALTTSTRSWTPRSRRCAGSARSSSRRAPFARDGAPDDPRPVAHHLGSPARTTT